MSYPGIEPRNTPASPSDSYTATLVATCYHSGLPDPMPACNDDFQRWMDNDRERFPEAVVTGFRQIYWKVFDRVIDMELSETTEFTLRGTRWDLKGLTLCISDTRAQALGAMDKRYIFVVAELARAQASDGSGARVAEIDEKHNEQDAVNEVFGAISKLPRCDWLLALRHERGKPPLFSLNNVNVMETGRKTRAGLFSFGAFQRLLMWQIDRQMTAVDLDSSKSSVDESMRKVVDIKLLSVNVHRYFLTHSITNNAQVRAFANLVRERYRLREEFERIPAVNAQMQEFLTLQSQQAMLEKSHRLNITTAITAVVGVPIALGSMLLTFNSEAPYVKLSWKHLYDVDVQLLLLTLSVVASLLLAVMFGGHRWLRIRRKARQAQ